MPIDRFDFDQISESDLTELLTTQVPEGMRIEYKRDMYGNADADKKEALKDISAFANAAGGHLVIGMDEAGSLPTALLGIATTDPDAVVLRLEQLVRSGVEPRIQGLRVRGVQLASGSYCFVVRVPRSWNQPHRVSMLNWNRYWVRNSAGCHEPDVDELRVLFNKSGDAMQRVMQFRDHRIAEICSGRGSRPLVGNGRLILHLVPIAAIQSQETISLQAAYDLNRVFKPLGDVAGYSPRFNLLGFINERGGDSNHGYTQVFRNGMLEATKASILRTPEGRTVIPALGYERAIFDSITGYLNGMRSLGVPTPISILLTFEGVKNATYAADTNPIEPETPIEEDILYLPDCLLEEYGDIEDYQKCLKPAIDTLWNSAGYPEALSYDEYGRWHGRRLR